MHVPGVSSSKMGTLNKKIPHRGWFKNGTKKAAFSHKRAGKLGIPLKKAAKAPVGSNSYTTSSEAP